MTLWPSLLPASAHGDDTLCTVSASGVRVQLADGRSLLCGTSGLWNTNLGYGNVAIADACASALRDASYLNVFRGENVYARAAAEKLVHVAGPSYAKVLFSTSGGAANDLVMKLSRQYHLLRQHPERSLVVGLKGSYHGLTFGAFSLTGEELGQAVYGVDQRQVRHLPPNDVETLERFMHQFGSHIAAFVVEPVLGTGAIALTTDYINSLLECRDRHGFVLVADEVATGFGRVGPFFASQSWARPPDMLVTSKGLTNGTTPAAAVLTSAEIAAPFEQHDVVLSHGETQAGTAVTGAAVVATINEMERLDAVSSGHRVAAGLDRRLHDLLDQPWADHLTGTGCFRSLRMVDPETGVPLPQHEVPAVVRAVRDAGAIVHPGLNGIQLVPALTYEDAELDELFTCLDDGVRDYWADARKAVLA